MAALKGLNKRTADTTAGDTYLTPRWAVDYLLDHWQPIGTVICDPCACGFRGWTIGEYVSDRYPLSSGVYRPTLVSDINPRHPSVDALDFRDIHFCQNDGPVTIVTNPPYDQLTSGAFMGWAWSQPMVQEVVILTRFGFLTGQNGARAKWLERYIQPPKRLAFEVLPEDVPALEATKQKVFRDTSTLTGYRLSSAGVDHGWAVYRRNYTGPITMVINPITKQRRLT